MSGKKRRREVPEAPEAVLAHASPGRLRLNFPHLKGKAEQLESLCDACVKLPGVTVAEGRPMTGSLIILFEGDESEFIGAAALEGVFAIGAEPEGEPPPELDAAAWAERIDSLLSGIAGPAGNLRNASALAFLFMALSQAAAGRIMPPAASALLTAVGLALGSARFTRDGWMGGDSE